MFSNFKIDDFILNHDMVVRIHAKNVESANHLLQHGNDWKVAAFNGFMNRVGLESVKTKNIIWVSSSKEENFKIQQIKN